MSRQEQKIVEGAESFLEPGEEVLAAVIVAGGSALAETFAGAKRAAGVR